MSLELFVARLLVVAAAFFLPLACMAEVTEAQQSAWTVLGRYSTSDGLGYDEHGAGIAVWRDHCGERLCMRSEVFGTTAKKIDGSSSYAGVATIEERIALGEHWWIGAATRWQWRDDGEGWTDQLALGAGWSDETAEGHGQAVHLRLLLPDSTQYETQGYEFRWVSLYPKWALAVEIQHVAYKLGEDREWGRRVTLLAGRRWIH